MDIAILILLVAVAIPTMVVSVIGMIWLQSPALNEKLYAGCLGVLAGLIIWQDLGGLDVVLIRYGASVAAGILFAYSYLKFEFIQNFALVLIVAAPVVVFLFVTSYPVKNELGGGQSPTDLGRASGASPIIVVVLDELSAPYLESSDGQIDEKLYPNFARLADESTWYRNAFSAADATVRALPTIMTGSVPQDSSEPPPPSSKEYPDNLCGVLKSGGYSINSSAQITNFCEPTSVSVAATVQLMGLGATNVLPLPESLRSRIRNHLYSDYSRDGFPRLTKFINRLEPPPRSFNFVHVTVPHQPWVFLPSGQEYQAPSKDGFDSDNTWSDHPEEVDSALQRYALQTGLVDRELGRMMAKLKNEDRWEDSMVVVTADHGIYFGAGGPRRDQTDETAGQALAIPLFIKYPEQDSPRVVSDPVFNTGIAPTVLQVAGVNRNADADGKSLLGLGGDKRQQFKRGLAPSGYLDLVYAELEEQVAVARRLNSKLFGSGSFYAIGGHAGLIGQRSRGKSDIEKLDLALDDSDTFSDFDPEAEFVPVLLEAEVRGTLGSSKNRVAIAVNGRIRATTRAWKDDSDRWKIIVVLPPTAFRDGSNQVEAFAIRGT